MAYALTEAVSDTSLSCACHPDIKPDTPHTLCLACQEFIDKCHWIQNHKLPLPNFADISDKEWENGAYIADGDASRGLNWDYELGINGRSSQCHLCALFDAVGSKTGESEQSRVWDEGVKVKINVYAKQLVQQPDGMYSDRETDSSTVTDRIIELEECSRLAPTNEVDDEYDTVHASSDLEMDKLGEARLNFSIEDTKGERAGTLRLVHELKTG
jgi:hypothetical protein